MRVARRGFLRQGVGAAVAGGLLASVGQTAFAKARSARPARAPGAYPTLEEFSDALYSWFMVDDAGVGPFDWIRLVEVTDLRPAAVKANRAYDGKECFALIFSGAAGHGSVRRSAATVHRGELPSATTASGSSRCWYLRRAATPTGRSTPPSSTT